jgi:hypothetical protein
VNRRSLLPTPRATTVARTSAAARHRRDHRAALFPRAALLIAILSLGLAVRLGAQIHYPDFRSVDGLVFAGTAAQSDSVIDLNGIGPKLSGAVWHAQKQPIGRGFVTTFVFQVSDTAGQLDPGGAMGGDGIAFVIQNASPSPVGGFGGQLGYDGIQNSIAIEFDTYANDEPGFDDPNGNHVAVHTTGTGTNSASHSFAIASNTNIPNLSDGRPHTVTIDYVNGALRVYLDGCSGLLISVPLDIERRIRLDNGTAWIGFTAATGSAWERHVLRSWTFNGRPLATPKRVSMCEGSAARLTPPGRFTTYSWSNGATTPSIDVLRPGTYTVTVLDTIPCTPVEHTYAFEVVESAAPRPRIAATDTLHLCTSDELTLDAGPYATLVWSTGAVTRRIYVTTPGLYWVRVTDSLGCSGLDSVRIVAASRPAPRVTITGATTFCMGDSAVLDAGPGFASYRWNTGATTQRITVRNGGSYSVTVTNAAGCSAPSAPVAITVLARPYPVINPSGPTVFCRGASVTLDAGAGYASYRWSNGASTRTIDVDTGGTYSVTATNASGCVGQSAPMPVRVVDPPTPEIVASPAASLCTGDTVTLGTTSAYASYRWSNGATSSTIAVTRSGVFTVDVVDSTGCAGSSQPFAVQLDSIGVLRLRASGPTDLCAGESVTLSAPMGLARYRWSTGDTTASIVVTTAGSYAIVTTDSAGCSGDASIDVRVYDQPVARASGDTTICEGTSVALAAIGGELYEWSPSEGLSCSDCASPAAIPSRSTRYRVIVSNPAGCSDTAWVSVDVLPAPRAIVRVEADRRVFPGEPVEIPVDVSGPIELAAVGDFTIDLEYDTSIMLLRGITLENGMLTGWTMETIADSPGRFRARFHSTGGDILRDEQNILTMRMQTFLGWPLRATIRPTLTLADRPCAVVTGTSGSVTIDSVCGVPGRLIEALEGSFALAPAAPNPFNPGTTIAMSIGTDGPAYLEIVSATGALVAVLHDGPIVAGTHRFLWDASSAPSGLYFARASAGEWRSTQPLLLVR